MQIKKKEKSVLKRRRREKKQMGLTENVEGLSKRVKNERERENQKKQQNYCFQLMNVKSGSELWLKREKK